MADRTMKVLAIVGGLAILYAFVLFTAAEQRHSDARALVHFYCQAGAVSRAQERGCEAHVSAATVDRYASQGDRTAIQAEQELSDQQDPAQCDAGVPC